MKKRKVYRGEVHHVCQMTQDKVVIFYSVTDYLVFFTIYCICAEKFEVDVLALNPMPDHLHNTVIVRSAEQLSRFVGQYTKCFSSSWNKSRGRRGPLFKHNFQCAAKLGVKQVRSTLAYNNNNSVERKMVQRAEEYRWNFLAYARNPNPFSSPQKPERSVLRNAKAELKALRNSGNYLNHAFVERLMEKLTLGERRELADYIIGLWNVIDYEKAISYYGDYETMLRAFHDNTGGEYDIKEDRDPYSDDVYADCTRILLKEKFIASVYEIPSLPVARKRELYGLLRKRTSARPKQLQKYLHIPVTEMLE